MRWREIAGDVGGRVGGRDVFQAGKAWGGAGFGVEIQGSMCRGCDQFRCSWLKVSEDGIQALGQQNLGGSGVRPGPSRGKTVEKVQPARKEENKEGKGSRKPGEERVSGKRASSATSPATQDRAQWVSLIAAPIVSRVMFRGGIAGAKGGPFVLLIN